MPVRGHADPLQARKSSLLTVHVDEGIVPRARGWAGASGTALFCGPLLIGVLATDRNIADDASVLAAVPVSALAALPGFGEMLAQHGLDVRIEHEPVLNAYLTASQAASREHPYAGMLPGITPPLATVYLRKQQALLLDPEQPEGIGAVQELLEARQLPLPADEVLAEEQTCVLIAGPGGGKTSLLRTRLAHGVTRWLEGRCENALPVMVTAAALDGRPLAQALAETVSADLAAHGLVDDLPPIFFRTPPQSGARWLVLVDSLDEIPDPAARKRVLGNLAAVSKGEHADLYRFVVASRPLPAGELEALGSHLAHYNLEPLRTSDLPGVASGWFREFGVPDPDRAARQFTEALARAQLTDVARIPLLASMLCQLQVAAPGEPLPPSRGKIFHDFTALLREREYEYTSDSKARQRQTPYAVLERFGPSATAQAKQTVSSIHVLITHLAAERYRGSTQSAIAIVESRSEAKRPQDVPQDKWRDFLGASLRASCLLTLRGHEYEFLHQTFLEYLAACDATRDESARHQVLLGMRPQGWWARYHNFWEPPARIKSSYYGFVIETWQGDERPLIRVLKRWACLGNVTGQEFLAEQMILGTALPDSVTRILEKNLESLARSAFPQWRTNSAAATLARLDQDCGAQLARDPSVTGPARKHAALELAKLGDKRGPDLLAHVAHDARLRSITRLLACTELAYFDRPRATDILATIARDSSLDLYDRHWAAKQLDSLGDERATPILAEIFVPFRHRIEREAVWVLALIGSESAMDHRLHLRYALPLTYLASPGSRRLEHRMVELVRRWATHADP
ncbi:hypothetical protein SUDANB105_05237 [Streptomyces sp. enrichment culture]